MFFLYGRDRPKPLLQSNVKAVVFRFVSLNSIIVAAKKLNMVAPEYIKLHQPLLFESLSVFVSETNSKSSKVPKTCNNAVTHNKILYV